MDWFFNFIWTILEPFLLYGFIGLGVVAFVFAVMSMFPIIRFKSIAFFSASIIAFTLAGFLFGQKIASREAELAAARSKIAAMEMDVAITKSSEADAIIKAEAQEAYADSLEKQVLEYEQRLAKKPEQPKGTKECNCALDQEDVDHLLRLGR